MVGAIGWSLNRADRRLMSAEQRPFHSQNTLTTYSYYSYYSYYSHDTLCSLTTLQPNTERSKTEGKAQQLLSVYGVCNTLIYVIHRLRVYNTLKAEGSWKSVSQAGCLSQCHTTLSQATECHQFPPKKSTPRPQNASTLLDYISFEIWVVEYR